MQLAELQLTTVHKLLVIRDYLSDYSTSLSLNEKQLF